jgi:hypothetical protein
MILQDWQNKHLDKDLLNWDKKIYGPNTCLFVTPQINSILILNNARRGKYPLGVTLSKRKNKTLYAAQHKTYGKQNHLGYFDTPEEAAQMYKQTKLKHIALLASKEICPKTKAALLALH